MIQKIAICRKKYDANVKNAIAKRSSTQRNAKAQHVYLGRNCWQTLSYRWFFRKCDVTLTILLEFSLRVATPLAAAKTSFSSGRVAILCNRVVIVKKIFAVFKPWPHGCEKPTSSTSWCCGMRIPTAKRCEVSVVIVVHDKHFCFHNAVRCCHAQHVYSHWMNFLCKSTWTVVSVSICSIL